jgi:radial spoke head protein 9
MNTLWEVRRNEGFKGLKADEAQSLSSYQHFRKVQSKDNHEQILRGEGVFNHDFLDNASEDFPRGTWVLFNDTLKTTTLLRSKLWPGYISYHRMNSPIFGGVYIGNGI